MARRTGAMLLLDTLSNCGTRYVFGIVGRESAQMSFWESEALRFILTRDERTAAIAAYVYGALCSIPGVCYSTFGPGVSNLVTGIAGAMLDRAPAIYVSAQVEGGSRQPQTYHQYLDQMALVRPVTKWRKEVLSAEELAPTIKRAFDIARSEPPGPVFVSVPSNVLGEELQATRSPCARQPCSALPRPSSKKVEKLASLLREVRSLTFVVGGAMARSEQRIINLVAELSTRTNALLVTTYSAKGLFHDSHQCFVGVWSKYLSHILRMNAEDLLFKGAELLVVFGVDPAEDLNVRELRSGATKSVCFVGPTPPSVRADYDIIIEGGIEPALRSLLSSLSETIRPDASESVSSIKRRIEEARRSVFDAQADLAKRRITPFHVLDCIHSYLTDNDVLVSDTGLHKQVLALFSRTPRRGQFICSPGLAPMGFGLPAAIGAAFARRKARIFAVCGDGGFQISMADLETCRRYNLNIVFIVMHDGRLGLIRHYQLEGGMAADSRLTDFGPVDYAALAESMGCRGYRVGEPAEIEPALEAAVEKPSPAVIDVAVRYDSLYRR